MAFDRSNGINWRNGIATKLGVVIALAIAVGAIGWGWSYGLGQERSYEQQARQSLTDQTENGCYQIAKTNVRSSLVKKPNSKPCTPDEEAEQESDKRREYTDLIAQRSSALWAKIMGIAALIGMGLSLVGVALVWTTFRETRKANEIAKDAMIAENRAWIKLSYDSRPFWMGRDDIGMDIIIRPENIGQSVARDVRCWGELYITHAGNLLTENDFERLSPQFYKTQQAENVWPANSGHGVSRSVTGLSVKNRNINTEKYRIFLIVTASYRTIFDLEGEPPKITELIQELTKVDGSPFVVSVDSEMPSNVHNSYNVGTIHSDIGSGRIT